eukprot:236755-Lingulodinium_polyedra.AAC.1
MRAAFEHAAKLSRHASAFLLAESIVVYARARLRCEIMSAYVACECNCSSVETWNAHGASVRTSEA